MKVNAHVALAWLSLLAATPVFSQTHAGHEGHVAPPESGAQTARVMTPQPVIGEMALVDQHGRATSLREALDTDMPVLVNFIFTSCTTICPVMTTGFARLQATRTLERDQVRLISISIDPETDTVDVLRAYSARYEAGPAWQFLTGSRAAVEAAQRAFGAYRGDRSNHAPVTYVRRTPTSQWEALDGLASADALMRTYRVDSGSPRF
jgi:protein SCO1/2